MKTLPRIIIFIIICISSFLMPASSVKALECISTADCQSECEGDPACSSVCEGVIIENGITKQGTCYTTVMAGGNQAIVQCEGVPYGVCIDGCQTRTCTVCNPWGTDCIDVLNIQGCDGMVCGRQTNGTGTCHPASVPPPAPACDQTGLLHKYFIYEGILLLL